MAASSRDSSDGNVPRGILYMIGATLVFSAVGAITKWELALYPPGEVAFLRQLAAFAFCSVLILPRTGLAVLKTERLGQHAMRGVSQFTSQMCLIIALMFMPLGSAMSISFSAPLFTVLLAVVLFGEKVGIHRAAALGFGFVGVLLVTEPTGGGFGVGAAFALANAIIYASVTVAVRRMSATESPETLTMHQMIALTLLMAALLPFGFTMPTPIDAALLAAAGVANGLGQLWWTRALHLAPSSAVMPFYYLSLVWAIGIGFLIWGDVPSLSLMAGAAVVMASGLYLIWRESLARRPQPASADPLRASAPPAALPPGDPTIDLHQVRHIQNVEYVPPTQVRNARDGRAMDTSSLQTATMPAALPRATTSGAFNEETVIEVRHWTDRLFSFRTTRSPSFRFDSGQFAMIGLMVEGKPLLRAYSMASASHEDVLEFYSIKVPDGPLTSRLQHVQLGDTVLVGRKPTGTLIAGNLRPGRRLYLLSTGTGIAPFLALIKDPEVYERFEHVVLVHGCRRAADLDFGIQTVIDVRDHEVIGEMASRQLLYYATVSREAYHHRGRITDALESGHIWQHLTLPPIDRTDDRVMLCGSTGMLGDVAAWLRARGFTEGSGAEPGDYVIEKAFAER
jgi:ferredoxin--NADP+ reductase